jgi:hypothetical protein
MIVGLVPLATGTFLCPQLLVSGLPEQSNAETKQTLTLLFESYKPLKIEAKSKSGEVVLRDYKQCVKAKAEYDGSQVAKNHKEYTIRVAHKSITNVPSACPLKHTPVMLLPDVDFSAPQKTLKSFKCLNCHRNFTAKCCPDSLLVLPVLFVPSAPKMCSATKPFRTAISAL